MEVKKDSKKGKRAKARQTLRILDELSGEKPKEKKKEEEPN